MLEILGKSLNGILLGTKRNEIGDEILNNPGYFLEFDRKNKVQLEASLITISVLDRKEFSLNGKIINFKNLSKFIKSEKNITEQEDDGYSYIFSEYNLVLYVDYIEQNFMQILIYDDSLKELYEG
ncbi:Uncharacterised protein [Fusobacterium polymorphum]|uniref:Uncharacterized protein n=1 Tax=Fusobacterium polymorphum ATCC 10953 TaxID=393480 RepID=A5TRW8_FUSNP|nr:hypothetical protein [Fusobacterium polymorphum]EDK87643.1 hypothetical protein FNP_2253 [Fusobacterium polymorphum ATCC 10953]UTI53233.1 hypothetical protein NLJ26_00915 [Fusobacterium polymorphum]WRL67754.1 hypothetical protein VKN78_07955 [Fusobacterium polymorphum]CKG64220.1 Uncharacterised protein [Fusobacterium polymorphum]